MSTTTMPTFANEFDTFCGKHRGLRVESISAQSNGNPERFTVRFDTFTDAQAFVASGVFTSGSARTRWHRHREEYAPDHKGRPHEWVGINPTASEWAKVVANPPQPLRDAVEHCMASLDEMPTAFGERPARRTVRGLEEGDELDAVRMQQDCNLDRAWSARIRRTRMRPVLRVALNAELRGGQGQSALAWRGACALAIARKAEESGADVGIDWVTIGDGTCSNYDRQLCVFVPLKKVGEFADRDALVAYCCHLASFRYFGFNMISALNPDASMLGWGRPLSLKYVGSEYDIVIDMHDVNCKASALRMISKAADIARAAIESN